MPRNWRTAPGLLAPPLVVALLTTACGPAAEDEQRMRPVSAPPADQVVLLDFDGGASPVGAIVPSVPNSGRADLVTEVVTTNGGRVHLVEGRDGGYAAQFPSRDVVVPRGAVLLVRPAGVDDPLSPGPADFAFGADVRLDGSSLDPGSGSDDSDDSDNGDNVLQRGLAVDPVQLKLQVDHGTPSCRVRGEEGDAFVEADATFEADRWYRVRCERNDDALTIVWESLEDSDDPDASGTASVEAPTGEVAFPAEVPLTVGGKAGPDGAAIESSPDQFNGTVDDVWYDVLGGR